ncbi:MAG: hypothetical protein LBE89_03865 [Helicobacteraceae bacterium]|jgi:hypothetical protein|nr:hypothetical protein [Helicobacteraceae bacterium]
MKLDDLDVAPRGIDRDIIKVVLLAAAGLVIFAPKVFIANEIYLKSLKLDRLRTALEVVEDENTRLKLERQRVIYNLERDINERIP